MRLAEPCPPFARRARRFHLYLWKWGKCRFTRLPSGAGLYSFVPTEQPLALELPTGERYRLNLPPCEAAMGYFVAFRSFAPCGAGDLKNALREAEWRTNDIRALSVQVLRQRFGPVPVAPEDAYSSGQCWYGSKAWAECFLGSPAPLLADQLASLPRLPTIEVPAFIAAAAYAAAYVVGRNSPLIYEGVTPDDVARAIEEGRKADGSGAYRLPRLNARPAARGRGGQLITATGATKPRLTR